MFMPFRSNQKLNLNLISRIFTLFSLLLGFINNPSSTTGHQHTNFINMQHALETEQQLLVLGGIVCLQDMERFLNLGIESLGTFE